MFHFAYVFERFPTFTQTFCVRELMELQRLGVRPLIFSIHDTREENIRQVPAALMDQVHFLPGPEELIHEVRALISGNRLPQSVVLTLRLWGDMPDKHRVYEAAWIGYQIRELRARVCHVHTHFAGVGARACWWLRKFFGYSYSFTVHANDVFCNTEPQTVPLPALFHHASLIVTVSDYMLRELRQRFPEDGQRVRRVYNGLDLAPFVYARTQADRSRAAGGILSVGRLIEKKGHDDLITACGLLRDRGLAFRCRIVGEGPLEAELRQQITRLQLSDRVELTGPRNMEDITRMLAEDTQVFALACKVERDGGKDNLPTVLMEAMAASLPCVSTRVAGVPEMVIDGTTGLLGEEKHPEQFAGLLAALLENPDRCEALGKTGLSHARRHFAKEKTARHLLRSFAEHASLRLDWRLALRQGLLGACLRRTLRHAPELGHEVVKARDKTFDLSRFMSRA